MAARRLQSKQRVHELFQQLQRAGDPAAREALILAHERLAVYLAKKFADRGEALEDIIQVAQIGLIKAIDRYDPSRGIEFTTYATPTIVGEIKRHFRDKLWPLHVPRRLRELNYALMRSVEVLSQRRGRSPTIEELAEEAGAPFDVVLEALEAGRAYAPASLEAETADDGTNDRVTSLAELIGDRDPTLGQLEDHEALEWAMRKLPRPLQEIVRLRFFTHLSQTEIAEKLGISQMHVSRKLRESLGRLKSLMAS